MLDFKIDTEKCNQCGRCSKECPTLIIDGKNGFPKIKDGKEKNCIRCQHCFAICQTGALSIFGKNPEDSLLVNDEIPSVEEMERLIKTRRSVRKYKDELIDEETINKLLQTTGFAPTGHNKNQVLLTVTYTKEAFDKVRDITYNAIKKAMDEGRIDEKSKAFANFQGLWESKGIDILFRNAPHIIIASTPNTLQNSKADSIISLSYFELLANSMGIATLWDGLAKAVYETIDTELQTAIGIPADHTIGYMMIFGKSAVKYTRSIQSEGLNLNRID